MAGESSITGWEVSASNFRLDFTELLNQSASLVALKIKFIRPDEIGKKAIYIYWIEGKLTTQNRTAFQMTESDSTCHLSWEGFQIFKQQAKKAEECLISWYLHVYTYQSINFIHSPCIYLSVTKPQGPL